MYVINLVKILKFEHCSSNMVTSSYLLKLWVYLFFMLWIYFAGIDELSDQIESEVHFAINVPKKTTPVSKRKTKARKR